MIASELPFLSEECWYVAHVCSRHEKSVAAQLQSRCVEHLLPLYEAVHRWKNGPARVQLPLFPGYLFVRLALVDRLSVLTVPGVSGLLSFGGRPHPLPETDIEALQRSRQNKLALEPYPYLGEGCRVVITRGPLEGFHGQVLRSKGKLKFVLSIDLIMRSVAVEVDGADLQVDSSIDQKVAA